MPLKINHYQTHLYPLPFNHILIFSDDGRTLEILEQPKAIYKNQHPARFQLNKLFCLMHRQPMKVKSLWLISFLNVNIVFWIRFVSEFNSIGYTAIINQFDESISFHVCNFEFFFLFFVYKFLVNHEPLFDIWDYRIVWCFRTRSFSFSHFAVAFFQSVIFLILRSSSISLTLSITNSGFRFARLIL